MNGRVQKVRWLVALTVAAGMVVGALGVTPALAQPTEAAQDGFVPMDDIPPEDQLPAAPLVMTAYAAAWVIVIGYLWTIWKRLGNVEKELADVGRRVGDGAGRDA